MGRTRNTTPKDDRERAATAREHFQVAQERLQLAPDGSSSEAQVAAANAVIAAIAASDAICGRALGYHSTEQDHRAAGKLLEATGPDGHVLAAKFTRLASDKTDLTYGGWCTKTVAARAVRDAQVLIDELDRRSL